MIPKSDTTNKNFKTKSRKILKQNNLIKQQNTILLTTL